MKSQCIPIGILKSYIFIDVEEIYLEKFFAVYIGLAWKGYEVPGW